MASNRSFMRLRANFKRNIAVSLGLNRVNSNLRQNIRYKKPAGRSAISSNRHLHTAGATTAIDGLKATISEEVPLCTGAIPLDRNNSQLFYRNTADRSLGYTPLIYSFIILMCLIALSISPPPSATPSWRTSFRLVSQQLLAYNNRMSWTSHIAKPGRWTLSTSLPTSILTILVSSKVYMACFLKIPNRQFELSCTS